MPGIELLTGNEKVTVVQCQEIAKEIGYAGTKFTLVGPKGELKCKWLDAHLGLIQIDGQDGFIHAKRFLFINDIYCKDILLTNKE